MGWEIVEGTAYSWGSGCVDGPRETRVGSRSLVKQAHCETTRVLTTMLLLQPRAPETVLHALGSR